jgi:hypothetical protein
LKADEVRDTESRKMRTPPKRKAHGKPPSNARLEDNLVVPFDTEILGVAVTVERVDMTEDERIVAVCTRGKSRQRVSILDLPLPDPPPAGAEWIDAFRRWAGGR